MTHAPERRLPINRWIVIGLFVLAGYLAFGLSGIYKPSSPAVIVPPEPTFFHIGDFYIQNTMMGVLAADLALIIMGLIVFSATRSGNLVPSGIYNLFEMIVEVFWNAAQASAGKWARTAFPLTATIFFLVFASNWVKLVPGFEAFGKLKEAHGNIQGYAPIKIAEGIYVIDGSNPQETPADREHKSEESHSTLTTGVARLASPAKAEEKKVCTEACEVVPMFRGAATDINFPLSIAIITMVFVQIVGVRALGLGYFSKFFNFSAFSHVLTGKPIVAANFMDVFLAAINFAVGILEIIAEFAKVISFTFRLFGSIFAGTLLLGILGALTATVVPTGLLGLELFFGAIQAYVFSTLALVFISLATVSHHGDDHGDDHHH